MNGLRGWAAAPVNRRSGAKMLVRTMGGGRRTCRNHCGRGALGHPFDPCCSSLSPRTSSRLPAQRPTAWGLASLADLGPRVTRRTSSLRCGRSTLHSADGPALLSHRRAGGWSGRKGPFDPLRPRSRLDRPQIHTSEQACPPGRRRRPRSTITACSSSRRAVPLNARSWRRSRGSIRGSSHPMATGSTWFAPSTPTAWPTAHPSTWSGPFCSSAERAREHSALSAQRFNSATASFIP